MKIGDTPPVIPPSTTASDGVDVGRKAEAGAPFATHLEGTPEATAPSPGGSPPVSDIAAIATEVDSGRMTASEAVQQVVDQVLAAQLPEGASPELRAAVRALVEATLESDPLLSGLVKKLGGHA